MIASLLDKGFEARRKAYDALVEKLESGKSLRSSEYTAMERFEAEMVQRHQDGGELPEIIETVELVAAYGGYSGTRTVYGAVQSGELQRLADGSFSREEVDRWLTVKRRQPVVSALAGGGAAADDEDDLFTDEQGRKYSGRLEDAKFRHFRARKEELTVQQMLGELLPRNQVIEAWTTRVHEVKGGLLLLKQRVAHKLAEECEVEPKIIEAVLDDEVNLLLKAFSRKIDIHSEGN